MSHHADRYNRPMPPRDVASILDKLAQIEGLHRITCQVDAHEEMAEITDRVVRSTNRAVLFTSVAGSRWPVVTNLWGAPRRIALALDAESVDAAAARLAPYWIPGGNEGSAPPVKRVKTAPCQQVVRLASDVDLEVLPIPRGPANDSPRVLSNACLYFHDPYSGATSIARLSMAIVARNRLALYHEQSWDLSRHLNEWGRRREHVPVAIVFCGNPAHLLTALSMWRWPGDCRQAAAALGGGHSELVRCRSHDLEIPADSEIVLEGYIDALARYEANQSIVNDLGYETTSTIAPMIEVTAITHRSRPTMPAMAIGQPPHELCVLREAAQRLLLPVVQSLAPEVADYSFPQFGAGRVFSFVSIHKGQCFQAQRIAGLLWGLPPWRNVKVLVFVDKDIDLQRPDDVWREVAARVCLPRDVVLRDNRVGRHDRNGGDEETNGQLCIDATAKIAGQQSQVAIRSEASRQQVTARWREYGLGPDPGGRA